MEDEVTPFVAKPALSGESIKPFTIWLSACVEERNLARQ